jgi:DNA segregation ATPase FtsK/SpoIIIE-like protein
MVKTKKHPFSDIMFVLIVILALFTGLSLFSYSAADPAYSNIIFSRYDETIHNIFGKAGSYVADLLGNAFGWAALLIPFALVYVLAQMVKRYRGNSGRGRIIGAFFTALMSIIVISIFSGLVGETDPYFANKPSGGIFGVTGAVIISSVLGRAGGVILCILLLILCVMAFARVSPGDLLRRVTTGRADTLEKPKRRFFKDIVGGLFKGIRNWFTARAAARAEARATRLEEERLEAEQEAQREALLNQTIEQEPVIEEVVVTPTTIGRADPAPTETVTDAPVMIVPPFVPPIVDPTVQEEEEEDEGYEGENLLPFILGEGEELLTVSRLEELLNKREAEQTVGRDDLGTPLSVDELFIAESPAPIERATNIKHRVYGDGYKLDFDLLDNPPEDVEATDSEEELRAKADLLLGKLRDFGVDGRVREIRPGPVVTLFELEPAPGIKINKIANLENDLALAMSAISIRIIAPIPGKAAVGIEVPNATRAMVSMRELLETKEFKQNDSPLAVALGKDISGRPYYSDLRKMPHLLVAGTTGSGKSVCVNTIICSVLYKSAPDKVKFVMIDPKMVELSVYEGIPHLMAPVVTDPRKASLVLQNVVKEMEARYTLMASCKVRSIDSYNELAATRDDLEEMPYMVVIVDEFADLMMVAGKEVENSIIRIAQMARAVGIHLVLATQRPSVNVITGIIKANMPARISFRVSSKIDSRTILDQNGAELLLGRGDSLFIPPGSSDPLRIHGSFVSEKEVLRVVEALGVYGEPEYNMDLLEDKTVELDEDNDVDELYSEAVKVARERGSVSVSMVQRYLRIGYNRAARMVEEMEKRGLIGPSDGTSKPREFIK